MTRAQHAAAGVIAGLLLAGIVVIAVDRPAYSRDSAAHALPESVGEFVGEGVSFCQNDQCLAVIMDSEHAGATQCPECEGELRGVSLAELRKLPADTEVRKRQYRDGRQSYGVSSVVSGYSRAGIHRPEVCLVAQGYRIVARSIEPVTAPSGKTFDVARLRAVNGSGRAVHYVYWFRSGPYETASHTTRIFRMGWDGIVRNTRRAWVYFAIVAPADAVSSSEREIHDLHRFLGLLHDGIGVGSAD